MRCQWTISSKADSQISLKFSAFDTESSYDVLRIYSCLDADCKTRTETKISGTFENVKSEYKSLGYMQIEFVSDEGGVKEGFEAMWYAQAIETQTDAEVEEEVVVGRASEVKLHHILIVVGFVVCQLAIYISLIRIRHNTHVQEIEQNERQFLLDRAMGIVPWYIPGAGRKEMALLQKLVCTKTSLPALSLSRSVALSLCRFFALSLSRSLALSRACSLSV